MPQQMQVRAQHRVLMSALTVVKVQQMQGLVLLLEQMLIQMGATCQQMRVRAQHRVPMSALTVVKVQQILARDQHQMQMLMVVMQMVLLVHRARVMPVSMLPTTNVTVHASVINKELFPKTQQEEVPMRAPVQQVARMQMSVEEKAQPMQVQDQPPLPMFLEMVTPMLDQVLLVLQM